MANYAGSGPYCYANSLAMVLGDAAPSPGTIEVLTGSPFGFELLGGTLPLFDPYGWEPESGLGTAIAALGWGCEYGHGGDADDAWRRLRTAVAAGPAIAGSLDMSLLRYQPGTFDEVVDHYVVVLAADDAGVVLHDPHAHPYATLPRDQFLAAWQGAGVQYLDTTYVLRSGFVRDRTVEAVDALRAAVPSFADWLAGRTDLPAPAGTLGNADGLRALAEQVTAGLPEPVRGHLGYFAIRVGARRLADAARCLRTLGLHPAADAAAELARQVGALQYPVVTGDDGTLAELLRRLAPGYERWAATLAG